MANSIVINLQVNMRGATNVDALNKALQSLRRTVGSMGGNFGASNLAAATKAAQNTAKAYTNIGTSATRAGQQQARAAAYATREQQRNLRIAQRQREEQERHNRAMKTLAGRMREVQPAYDAIFRAGYRLQEVGRDMMQIGERGLDFIRDLSQEFGQFEFMINRAAGAMSLSFDTVDQGVNIYERFKSRILEASRELRLFKAEDVAKATYFWASATGQQVDSLTDLESVLRSVNPLMKVAAMTQTDYETAIKGVYSIITQYGKSLGDTEDVTQKLFQVTQMTAAEFPDLINSFKMVGPVAAANSVTFEQVANVLGRLADAGIRGSMAGRGLRQFFIQTVRPSKIAKAALDDLWASTPAFQGKTFEEMIFPGGTFVGIDKYVNELAVALKNATEAERNFLLGRVTTANELPILTALVVKQIGVLRGTNKGWDAAKENLANSARYFDEAWDKLAESWLGVVGAFERGVESLRIILGGRIAAILTPFVKQVTAVIETIIAWAENPANQDVIDFFLSMATAISGLLAVGGSVMLFAGSMTNLAAAFELVIKVFGQTIPKVLLIGAAFSTLAAAVVRNADYIIEAGREIVDNLSAAFGGSGDIIGDATNAFEVFGQTVAPILDAVVRGVVDLARVLSQFVRAVMEFGPARQIIQTIIAAFGILFGARMVAGVLGLSKILSGLRFVLASLVPPIVMMGPASARAAGGMSAMARASTALSGAMTKLRASAGGWIGLIAVGILAAYETIPPFHDAVDELLDLFIDKAPEAQAAMEELVASFDQGPKLKNWLESTPMFAMLEKNLKEAEEWQKRAHDSFFENPFDQINAKGNLEDARIATSKYIDTFIKDTQAIVDKYAASGTPIDINKFYAKMFEAQRTGATPEQARKIATDFFDSVVAEMKEADARAQRIIDQFKGPDLGAHAAGRLTGFDSKDYKERLIAQLLSMKESVSPMVAEQIELLLDESSNAGFVAGAEDIIENAGEVAPKTWSEVANAITSSSSGIKDLGKRIKEAIETALSPGQQANVLRDTIVKWTKKGFKDARGKMSAAGVAEAAGAMQDFVTNLPTQLEGVPPAEYDEFIRKQIRGFVNQFGPIWDKMPPQLQTSVEESIRTLYGYLGEEEVPQSVLNRLHGEGETAAKETAKGVNSGAGTIKKAAANSISTAERAIKFGKKPFEEGKTVPTDLAKGMDDKKRLVTAAAGRVSTAAKPKTGNSYNWGYHLVQNFAAGMRMALAVHVANAVSAIASKIRNVLGHSVPKEGPLSDDDKWGGHFVENLVDGMRSKLPALRRQAFETARAMAIESRAAEAAGITFESNARRTLKVQIEVTSPDGSVDRVKASQLESALATNDLILAIEHMSTVG